MCIGWVPGVVFTKYQSSTLFHFSVSVTGRGSPYGRALRFSFQRGVSAPTSFSVIIRAATASPLSFGGPRLVSSVTFGLTGSDPGPGTLIGAPLDALCLTVICMTRISGGAGVDTGPGGVVFVMSSVRPANRRKSQITSYRSAGDITRPFALAGLWSAYRPGLCRRCEGQVRSCRMGACPCSPGT